MEPVIKVEQLGKRYRIGGRKKENYTALRDVIVERVKDLVRNPLAKPFREEYFWALRDINFEVHQGEVLGVIGPNGAGKSTLLKILSRITEPTKGRVTLHGRVASLLEVGTGFHPELTGRENIYLSGAVLGMRRSEIRREFDEIVDFSGVGTFLDTPVKRYSSGMRVRLGFAVAAYLQPEILLIDEVLAVGDAEFQKRCLGKMGEVARGGRTVLFVSHNLGAIKNICGKAMLIERGKKILMGDSPKVVAWYHNSRRTTNEAVFGDKALRYVRVYQEGSVIKIEATYSVHGRIVLPKLGFVFFDIFGQPIMGSNPVIAGVTEEKEEYPCEGRIKVLVKEPKLFDGTYYISFWFGFDGLNDIQYEERCVLIEVSGMVDTQVEVNSSRIGWVYCESEYSFL